MKNKKLYYISGGVFCALAAALAAVALTLIAIYIGTNNISNESSWYLTMGVALICAANFTNLAMQKKGKQ